MLSANQYSLNVLPSNPINNNQYVYLSGIDGTINIVGNEWYLVFYLYLNDKFALPANTLTCNITLPFSNISSLTLNQVKNYEVPDYVIDKTTSDCYQVSYIINTNECDFFNQKLVNYPINFDFSFGINESALNSAQLPNAPNEVDELISEFDSLSSQFTINYSNYINSSQSITTSIPVSYAIVDNQASIAKTVNVTCTNNDNVHNLKDPLKDLLTIDLDDNFTINGYQVDFYYSVDESEIKNLSIENKDATYCTGSYSFAYPYQTAYDEAKQEVTNVAGDNPGFYIDDNASGYYVITALILTSTGWFTLKISNNFDFVKNDSYGIGFKVVHFLINDLTYFKEMKI